jgi:hypothetical protein
VFFPGSRYADLETYSVTTPRGVTVKATVLPLPERRPLVGFHRRLEGQRLDLIANRYLADPTAFWRLCDANGSIAPDALGARDLVGAPRKGG